ncbi:beta-N-acetylhexosaminidase [Zunongwangia sp. HRR-M8]|uniref:beta-N-acetylhexosaminidase n=1 Tax=Zunongwangia sp. HRR-M8 TaxID=3015170 RepID=UPI0022DDA1D4|nr:beta-N-acetylhexosaminidase [Zunongwangia sp. HRR-M8]WBL22357.1 beta-N-acetylhexosaminidase [Zunongwangia sp. HRR-M8]
MKLFFFSVVVVFSMIFNLNAQDKPAIIPKPNKIEWTDGEFQFSSTINYYSNPEADKNLARLQDLLKTTGSELQKTSEEEAHVSLKIDKNLASKLSTEGYQLKITSEKIEIIAAENSGLFYGIITLRQLFPAEVESGKITSAFHIPAVEISDKPYYQWRGTMIDMARSFFGLDYLKKHIDRMALYKLNRLHLHLSDDQGWRIEIKKWPKLTEIGGQSAVENGQSGYLTQKQFKELQEYARERNVMIIPEIDMPGHTYAALQAYPELSCENFENLEPKRATPPESFRGTEVGWSKFCMEKPLVYEFIADVIAELAEITEAPYLHIGGDEIEDKHYKDFVIKAEKLVRLNGKTTIGWEEVTQAQVDVSFISQRWTGTTESVVDTRVIESICKNFYLDHGNVPDQPNTYSWCKKDGVSLENVYSFISENRKAIGVEGALWTELVHNAATADDRLWPRSIAVAEVGWTAPEKKNYTEFTKRLGLHGKRLFNLDVNFYTTPNVDWNTTK